MGYQPLTAQSRALIVGSESEFPPLSLGTTDDSASGFTVELWRLVAKEQGLAYTIHVRPFGQLLQEFKQGKLDVLLNLAQSDERRQFADFSVTHSVIHGGIFVRQGAQHIHSETDLSGKSIIVLNRDLAHDYAVQRGWARNLVLVSTAKEALEMLSSGRGDAVLLGKLIGLQTLRKYGIANVSVVDTPVGFSQRFSFAVPHGDVDLLAKLNEGLAVAKASSAYDSLYEKWIGIYESKPLGPRDLLKYAFPAAAATLLMFTFLLLWRQRERRRAEEALRASEERFRNLTELSSDWYWEQDADFRLVFNSPRYSAKTGLRMKPPIGQRRWETDNIWESEQQLHDHKATLDAHQPFSNLYLRRFNEEGELRHFLISGTPVFSVSRKFIGYRGVGRDITDQKRASEELEESERRFKNMMANVDLVALMLDSEGNITYCNEYLLRLTGWRHEEVMGRSWVQTFLPPEISNETREVFLSLLDGVDAASHHHNEILTRSGSRRLIHWNNTVLRSGAGAVIGTASIGEDITARQEMEQVIAASERRMQTIIANVPAMIGYWGQDGRCMFGNQAYADWFGITPETLPGLTPVEVLGNATYALSAPHFEAAFRGESQFFERSIVDRDGKQRHIQVSFLPDRCNGAQLGFFAFAIDVTELNRMVEERTRELSAARDAAESANRVKDEIIANVSHEMRTPLHGILSFARLGQTRLSPDTVDKCLQYFAKIQTSGIRLAQFVDNLLELARLGAGEVVPDFMPTDLPGLVNRVANEMDPLLQEKRLSVNISTDTAAPTADVDAHLMERVMVNLLSNARKYSPIGGTIEVTISDVNPDSPAAVSDPALQISVIDQGPGIPDAELEAIFAPFVQSTRTDKRAGGTGLGLPIVRKIVALHGGAIRARNNDGGGAVFEVVLPRRVPAGKCLMDSSRKVTEQPA